MIDLHTHIIWDIDDGSKSIEMSTVMLSIAAQKGTTSIFATPHVIEVYNKPSWEVIVEKSKQIQNIVDNQKLNIKIYPGAEIQMNWELISEIGEQGAYCLNGGKYALIELPVLEIPEYADEFFYRLMLKGIIPIIAHPERNKNLMQNPSKLLEWMRKGILLQCNSGSITGSFGKQVRANAELLLKNKLISFVGSDAHRDKGRDTNLYDAKKIILDIVGDGYCKEIFYINPERVLQNELVEIDVPTKIYEIKSTKSIWSKIFNFIR
ncbi:MAG: hypothetical protein IKT51_03920 [Phascolarctobacterium sp.]|nr:hypothetical protein [Phascolarctobacterium sp.]MBR6511375.1 hypothetical protein [Phascolarctobacterium sp.]